MIQQPSASKVTKTLLEMYGITDEAITGELKELLREASRPTILFWDIDDIVRATSYGKSFLEENILCNPRVKQHERKRGKYGKRVWPINPVAKIIEDIIMNEWE